MSGAEIITIVVGLIVGYWVISFFLGKRGIAPSASGADQSGSDRGDAPDVENAVPDADSASSPRPDLSTWHQVLEVSAAASEAEIRAAYRRLMSQYHPDKVASLGAELRALAERKSKEINLAYRDAMKCFGIDP